MDRAATVSGQEPTDNRVEAGMMQGQELGVAVREEVPPALAVEALSHSFGSRQALRAVGFDVPAGRFAV